MLHPRLGIRRSVQQQSTATTALSNAFGFIQMRPGQRKQGNKRLLRGVRDEEVAGLNAITPTNISESNLITEVKLYLSLTL